MGKTSRGARLPLLTTSEQLGAIEGVDAVTKSTAELNATIAKATKIRQDEHLNDPVILPVENERLMPNIDAASQQNVNRGIAHA